MYKRSSWLIERYIFTALLPYLGLALLLSTVAVLAQQSSTSRFADILMAFGVAPDLTLRMMLALIPSVLLFTLPMSILIGTTTAFGRLSSDSELTAMQAAGVGVWRICRPVLCVGGLTSGVALYVALVATPEAARALRATALRAALYRLESPVDPRTFKMDGAGKVFYVRDGDKAHGHWGRVFIYWQEKNSVTRLITARNGRIDSSAEQTELVLSDAVVTTLTEAESGSGGAAVRGKEGVGERIIERSQHLRLRDDRLNTGRNAILKRLQEEKRAELEELPWRELLGQARATDDARAQRAAIMTIHKKLSLSLAPLVFSLLGVGLGLGMGRGGRGHGVLLALAALIAYYLAALAGEQLVRANYVAPFAGIWAATMLSGAIGLLMLLRPDVLRRLAGLVRGVRRRWRGAGHGVTGMAAASHRRNSGEAGGGRSRRPFVFGLLDRHLLRALSLNFALALAALIAIFIIFTLFELIRFIAAGDAVPGLIARYLFYLLPFVGVAMAPMSLLVAVIIVYAVMARRSEAVAWWACGQSVYRLTVPGLLFAASVGVGVWLVQEKVMPAANRRQDALRAQIRGGTRIRQAPASTLAAGGRNWLATFPPPAGSGAAAGGEAEWGGGGRITSSYHIYSYEYRGAEEAPLKDLVVYEFDDEGVHLARIIRGERGGWADGGVEIAGAQIVEFSENGERGETSHRRHLPARGIYRLEMVDSPEIFKPTLKSPSEMNIAQLSEYIKLLKKRGENVPLVPLALALERKRATPLTPLVMCFVGVPLALGFGRRGAVVALVGAVGVGLGFWGVGVGLQQFGSYGLLPAIVAVWAPHLIFTAVGLFLLFRART